jgi:hypothetical protein
MMAEAPPISDAVMITAIVVGGIVSVLFYALIGYAFYHMAKSRHQRAYEEGRLAGANEVLSKINNASEPATSKSDKVILG